MAKATNNKNPKVKNVVQISMNDGDQDWHKAIADYTASITSIKSATVEYPFKAIANEAAVFLRMLHGLIADYTNDEVGYWCEFHEFGSVIRQLISLREKRNEEIFNASPHQTNNVDQLYCQTDLSLRRIIDFMGLFFDGKKEKRLPTVKEHYMSEDGDTLRYVSFALIRDAAVQLNGALGKAGAKLELAHYFEDEDFRYDAMVGCIALNEARVH